jgi:hypothetical protein
MANGDDRKAKLPEGYVLDQEWESGEGPTAAATTAAGQSTPPGARDTAGDLGKLGAISRTVGDTVRGAVTPSKPQGKTASEEAGEAIKRGWRALVTPPPPRLPPQGPARETMGAQPGFWSEVGRLAGQGPGRMEPRAPAYENMTPEGRAEHPVLARVGDVTRGAKEYGGMLLNLGGLLAGPEYEEFPTIPRTTQAKLPPVPKVGVRDMAEIIEREMARPPTASAGEQLEAAAQRIFKQSYGDLKPEQRVVVARNIGGGPAPGVAERRTTVGTSPTPVERRAGAMPLPSIATEAAAARPTPFKIAEKMGVRWAQTPGLPDISIPKNLVSTADIDRYVAEKQALQAAGVPSLQRPGTPTPTGAGIARPGAPAAPTAGIPGVQRTFGPAAPGAESDIELELRGPPAPGTIEPVGKVIPPKPQPRSPQGGGMVIRGGKLVPEEGAPPPTGTTEMPPSRREAVPRKPPTQPGTPERPPPGRPLERIPPLNEQTLLEHGIHPENFAEETDPLKREFPDAAVRRFARANGPEIVRATEGDPEALRAVHDLTNVEIRQAAINAGMDLGTKHVGQKIGLGPEQISRQELLDRMIRQGVKPEAIPELAKPHEKPGTVTGKEEP